MKGSAHRKPLINAHSLPLVSSAGLHSRSCHPWGWRAAFPGSPRALRVQLILLIWPHELPRPLGRAPGPASFWPQFQELPHGSVYFLSAVSYISQETHLFYKHPLCLLVRRPFLGKMVWPSWLLCHEAVSSVWHSDKMVRRPRGIGHHS